MEAATNEINNILRTTQEENPQQKLAILVVPDGVLLSWMEPALVTGEDSDDMIEKRLDLVAEDTVD